MKDNNRSLTAVVLTVCVLLSNVVLSQNNNTLAEVPLDSSAITSNPEWKIGLDVSSVTAGLLGASSSNNFLFGIQLNRRVNQWSSRFSARLYPGFYNTFSNDRIIQVIGNEAEYLSVQNQGWMSEVGFGIERSRAAGNGRAYLALDANLLYGQRNIQAYTYLIDPVDKGSGSLTNDDWQSILQQPKSTFRSQSIGFGLMPTIGYSFYVSDHLGIDVEGRIGASIVQSDGYNVANDATISKSSDLVTLRFSQLLSLRLHYRF